MSFEIARIVPVEERPTEKPIPPHPMCAMTNPGTQEEWDHYWTKRDAYYHGLELREVK